MRLDFTLDDAAMRKLLDSAPKRGVDAWHAAMFRRAQDLLDIAQPMVPFRRGKLWASRVATRTAPVEVAFTAPHAIPVHERHAQHVRGQWKFLETAMQRLASQGPGPLAKYFEEGFKRGDTLASVAARHPEQVR